MKNPSECKHLRRERGTLVVWCKDCGTRFFWRSVGKKKAVEPEVHEYLSATNGIDCAGARVTRIGARTWNVMYFDANTRKNLGNYFHDSPFEAAKVAVHSGLPPLSVIELVQTSRSSKGSAN